jgi:hypothetical protein
VSFLAVVAGYLVLWAWSHLRRKAEQSLVWAEEVATDVASLFDPEKP